MHLVEKQIILSSIVAFLCTKKHCSVDLSYKGVGKTPLQKEGKICSFENGIRNDDERMKEWNQVTKDNKRSHIKLPGERVMHQFPYQIAEN